MKTTIKPLLWEHHQLSNGSFTIKIKVTKNRKTTYLTTPFSATPKQWDATVGRVYKTHPNSVVVNDHIENLLIELQNSYLNSKMANPAAATKAKQATLFNVPSFLQYLRNHIKRLDGNGKFGSRKKYNTLLNHLTTFLGESRTELFFHEINKQFLDDFQTYLYGCGLQVNGMHTYYKAFKKLYTQAINEDLFVPEKNAFKGFKLPEVEEVQQRHLTLIQLKKIIRADVQAENELFHTKNYFLFQIFANGMRVSDLDLLRWSHFTEDSIKYQMLKTGKNIEIPFNHNFLRVLRFYTGADYSEYESARKKYHFADFIVDKGDQLEWQIVEDLFFKKIIADIQILSTSSKTKNNFVFPILKLMDFPIARKNLTKLQYQKMESRNVLYNRSLKLLAKLVELDGINLSTHYCRHTFTHLMVYTGEDIYDISKSLGHSNLNTTQIYADRFNKPRVKKVSDRMDKLIRV